MYRTVKELTRDEINELKENYFWDCIDNVHEEGEHELPNGVSYPEAITDDFIFEYYGNISFSEDDFWCNQ